MSKDGGSGGMPFNKKLLWQEGGELIFNEGRGESSSAINYYHKKEERRAALSIKLTKYQGHTNDTFEYYQKSIKKILKDKNVIAKIPAILLPDFPQELLCGVWHNFIGFSHNPGIDL